MGRRAVFVATRMGVTVFDAMSAYFGPPAHVYYVGPDTVLTYRKNLLADAH
jgi:hypothetical protein